MDAHQKALDEQKRKEEEAKKNGVEPPKPASAWVKHGGPIERKDADAIGYQNDFSENEFVLNYLQKKGKFRRHLRALQERALPHKHKLHNRFLGGFGDATETETTAPVATPTATTPSSEDVLCKPWEDETKQRAGIFSILDVDADG